MVRVHRDWYVLAVVIVLGVAAFLFLRSRSQTASGASDVNVADCRHTPFGTAADVVVRNTASKPSTYFFTVNFVDQGVKLDSHPAVVAGVAPGGPGGQTVISARVGAGIECRVTKVSRAALP